MRGPMLSTVTAYQVDKISFVVVVIFIYKSGSRSQTIGDDIVCTCCWRFNNAELEFVATAAEVVHIHTIGNVHA